MLDIMNELVAFALFLAAFIAAMQFRDEPEIARRARKASTRLED